MPFNSTQEAPASASKVERSSIMSGATSPTSNVANTDNADAVPAELVGNQDATAARIAYVGRVKATGVTVSPATATLVAAATQQLTRTMVPANAGISTVTYASSNTAKATVNASGLVTAVATGSAVITVTTTDGGYTATSAITVS